jgi:hypothetical protein
VTQFRNGGRLLEIGPSKGAFCLLAKRAGFEVRAIEIDASCVAFLRDQMDFPSTTLAIPTTCSTAARTATMSSACGTRSSIHRALGPCSRRPQSASVRADRSSSHVPTPTHGRPPSWGHAGRTGTCQGTCSRSRSPGSGQHAARLGLVVDLATTRDIGSLRLNRSGWSMAVARLPLPLRVVLRRIVPILAYPWDSVEGRGSCYCVVLRRPPEPSQVPGHSAAGSGG